MNFPVRSDDLKRESTCYLGQRADTRLLFDDDRFEKQLDFDLDFGKFEGDWGALFGRAIGRTLPFDLPFVLEEHAFGRYLWFLVRRRRYPRCPRRNAAQILKT